MYISEKYLNFNYSVCQFVKSVLSTNENLFDNKYQQYSCFYTQTGISSLKIEKEFNLFIVYYNNADEVNVNFLFEIQRELKRVVFIVNGDFLKKYSDRLTVIDITKFEQWVDQKDNIKFIENSLDRKNSLNIDFLERYINFCIRIGIVASYYREAIPLNIKDYLTTEKPVMPFIYYLDERKIIFYEDIRQIRKEDSVDCELIKVIIKDLDSNLYIKFVSGNKTFDRQADFVKINTGNFKKCLNIFNNGAKFSVTDYGRLYKYRQFEKTRYSAKEESVSYKTIPTLHPDSLSVCVGSRTAIENGTIWFSDYSSLNDPFDLDMRYPKALISYHGEGDDILKGEKFSILHDNGVCVFCTTEKSDNLLMWSHYGCSHQGICSEYSKDDILLNISKDPTIYFCFYGKVKYSDTRERFRITKSLLRFISFDLAVLLFNIKNLFTKFGDWKYESEYRFVLFPISSSLEDYKKTQGHALSLKPNQYFISCNFPNKYMPYLRHFKVYPKKYSLDDKDYELKI